MSRRNKRKVSSSLLDQARKTEQPDKVTPSMGLAAMLGVQDKDVAANLAHAMDMFSNPAARTGYGNPNLIEGTEYPLVRTTFNYTLLYSLYESSWIARRIVDTPASDMCRAWPKLTSDIEPKELSKIDRVLRKTNTKNNLLTAMKWARLFGGAGALIVVEGQEHELDKPLNLDEIPIGSYAGLIPFDRWSGIYPGVKTCQDIKRPVDFNLPESYNVQGVSGSGQFEVHASRILRFTGPTVPTPEREAYSMWGISVIEPVLQELKKRDNVSANIAALTFRANILGMKFPDLAALLSGLGMPGNSGMKFEQRMSALNHLLSSQSLVPLPADGSIESTQYSFAGLGEVYQQFCLDISGAAQIPVARLWGRTITGLGQTGDGDEKIYCERIATDQDTDLRPQLEKLYPVLCASELGEVPDDLDLNFPSLAVPDDKEKAELAKSVADVVTVAMNGGIISPRTAAKELKQSSDKTGIFTNITPEDIEKLSDEVSSEGELGEGLFGEAGGGLNPSSGPAKALKEENKVGKATQDPSDAPAGHQAPARGALGEGEEGLRELAKAADSKMTPELVWLEACDNEAESIPRALRGTEEGQRLLRKNALGNLRVYAEQYHVPYEKCLAYVKGRGLAWDDAKANDADGPGPTVYVHGLECIVETPKGEVRSGKGWEVTLPYSYGYIKGVQGADGDSMDVALGTGPDNGWAYLIDQRKLNGQGFDETKCFLQWPSATAALNAFKAGHHRWEEVLMDWTPMPVAEFKQWLKTGDHSKPVGGASK